MKLTINTIKSNSNFGFWGEGKAEYPEKTSRCRVENKQTQPTLDTGFAWESNPGHIGGRRVLSPLRHPCTRKDVHSQLLSLLSVRIVNLLSLNGFFSLALKSPSGERPIKYTLHYIKSTLFESWLSVIRFSSPNFGFPSFWIWLIKGTKSALRPRYPGH